jgi:hypothetical protein
MKKTDVIKRLEEFNKFADELFNSNFVEKLRSGLSHKLKWKSGEGFSTESKGPQPISEETKAFVNDIRRFFQKSRFDESLNIYKLVPIYNSDLIENNEKRLFNKCLSEYDKFSNEFAGFVIDGEKITNKRIYKVFLYGRISHRTEETKEIYDDWEKIAPTNSSLNYCFIKILREHLRIINNIAYGNKNILKKLKQEECQISTT